MYISQLIEAERIEEYGSLIPECYRRGIERGKLFAVETLDPLYPETGLMGVTVMGVRDSWAGILWYALTEEFDEPYYAKIMIRERLKAAYYDGEAVGVYATFPKTPENEERLRVFEDLEFEIKKDLSHVLEFSLGSINTERLPSHFDEDSFFPLKKADRETLKALNHLMAEDERNIPVEIPVPWDRFDKELSMIHVENGAPKGVILVSGKEEKVSVDLAFETTPTGILRLVAALAKEILKKKEPDTVITVPIVNDRLFDVMKVVAPKAERAEIYKAYYIF